ncbi:MAG: bifunctional riboflavin kinase/FAD synthetase [Salinisphaera sp.]|nr:bifunctional riboflavin kinase/FAD synthetase [Salinisphaera sp.]
MEFIRGLANLRARHHGNVLTIGNYDGLHRGHQAVMARLREVAAEHGLPAMVMTFEPHPAEYFARRRTPTRLSSLREKITDVAAQGLDRFLCVRFDRAFAGLSAQEFASELVAQRLGARVVLVGEDFRFGHGRRGDVDLLAAIGREHGFAVVPHPAVEHAGERVSSTRVRAALAAGKVDRANALLGRPYRIGGRVEAGARLGRTLGVPTINLRPRRRTAPRFGVYAARVRLVDGRLLDAAASLGTRPTVAGTATLLEAHLLDFREDLYGQRVDVQFHAFLRPEVRFDDVETLSIAMQMDIARTRAVLAAIPSLESNHVSR